MRVTFPAFLRMRLLASRIDPGEESSLQRCIFCFAVALAAILPGVGVHPLRAAEKSNAGLRAGFAETDITPTVGANPVYMAGFGQNRKATRVHDSLKARAIVLQHAGRKLAIVAVDVVGFFNPNVLRVREQLPGFTYVLVTSTHNHE